MGHAFVVLGDIARIHCDAWLVSGTREGGPLRPSEVFADRVGESPAKVDNSATVALWEPREAGDPLPVVCDVVSGIEQGPDALTARVREGLALADAGVRAADPRKQRVVVAMPFMGTGKAGGAPLQGKLLQRYLEVIRVSPVDGILVLYPGKDGERREIAEAQLAAADALRLKDADHHFAELDEDLRRSAQEIAATAAAGHLALFLGAGVSAAVGAPSWESLIRGLYERVFSAQTDQSWERLRSTHDLLALAEAIARRVEREGGSLREHIREQLGALRLGLQHLLLARLPFREAVTTNYDRLLEEACDLTRPVTVLPEAPEPGGRWLLKMHGDIEEPDKTGPVVLTWSDYVWFHKRSDAAGGVLQALLLTRRLLVIGFSLSDPNFFRLYEQTRRYIGGEDNPAGFALNREWDEADCALWEPALKLVATRSWRLQEIFLDYAAALATRKVAHVSNPYLAELLDDDERALKEALEPLTRLQLRGHLGEVLEQLRQGLGVLP